MRPWTLLVWLACAQEDVPDPCARAAAHPEEEEPRGWVATAGATCRQEVIAVSDPEAACGEITIMWATDDGRCWWFSCYLLPPSELARVDQTTTTMATLATPAGGSCDLAALSVLPVCEEPAVVLCAQGDTVIEIDDSR